MAGRVLQPAKANPGVRTREQQRRRGQLKESVQERGQAEPRNGQDWDVHCTLPVAEEFCTGGPVVVTEAAAQSVKQHLACWKPCRFLIARLWTPAREVKNGTTRDVSYRILPNVLPALRAFASKDLVIGKVYDAEDGVWLGFITTLDVEEASEVILDRCRCAWDTYLKKTYTRPDAWRFDRQFEFDKRMIQYRNRGEQSTEPSDSNFKVVEGEPFALDVVSGPHPHIPHDLDEPKPLRVCSRGFALPGFRANLSRAAQSDGVQDLLDLLSHALGAVFVPDDQGLTALHLAALAGDVGVAEAVQERARSCAPHGHPWCDRVGRTPLHYAAFMDSDRLAQVFLGLCKPDARDRWGRTALDLASSLGNHSTATALAAGPQDLLQICQQRIRKILHSDTEQAGAMLASAELPQGLQLADCVPLHEYGALRRLAEAVPRSVAPSTLLRSMSCLECWYADLLNNGCAPALPGCLELLRVWEELPGFQGGEGEPDADGAVLVRAPSHTKPPTLADRATFCERFHRRTGGILKGMDWSNVMVIGGMVLACLTADDEEYARNYKETDVDIYVVGLSGKAFKQRVAEIASSLPKAVCEDDYFTRCSCSNDGSSGKPFLTVRVDKKNGWLEIVDVQSTSDRQACRGEDNLQPGSVILRVDYEYCTEEMARLVRKGGDLDLLVRPREAVKRSRSQPSATLLRTPQTLTACVRGASGQRLPNVQIVLAPYSSPAHLLFTTDIDSTAMGFDGKHLLATPRAREAIRRRRNIARPEKYSVRGEWRTEARLLKYAVRGFRVVDLGLGPNTRVPEDATVSAAAQSASLTLQVQGSGASLEAYIRAVCDTGVHGARLLLLAARSADLRRLMLHEVPKIRAGMDHESVVGLVHDGLLRSGMDWYRQRRSDGQQGEGSEEAPAGSDGETDDEERRSRCRGPVVDADGDLEMDDGYGKAKARLLLVNPARLGGNRMKDGSYRGKELSLQEAITELDLESDRFEVRGWYEGLPPWHLQRGLWELDPAVWRGAGDFRRAP